MFGRKPWLDGVSVRGLMLALALSLAGLPGLLVVDGESEPVNLLAWFALIAPAVGCLGAQLRLRFWPLGFVAPAMWMAGYTVSSANLLQGAPTPFYGALVWTGFFTAGWAIGVGAKGEGWTRPCALLLLGALAASMPSVVSLLGESPPQSWIALALDLSPVTCVLESAGLDWMRHASVYDLAGSLPPDARTPYRGMLAGPLLLVVGWGLVMVAESRTRSGATA